MEISIIPIGTKSTSTSDYVAAAIKVLEREKTKHEITSMGTIVEGELRDLFKLAEKMHEAVFSKGVARVITNIHLDERRDKTLSIESKLKSIREKLTERG